MEKKVKKIMVVFGTRPEAIKLLPVVKELKKYQDVFETYICVTAQHREMLDQVLELFDIQPEFDLNVMQKNQSLSELTANIITKLEPIVKKVKPDYLVVQGDTTTTFIASLVGFYHKVGILHVEAGLRTNNKYSPFPEEINRRITSTMVHHHFAPTEEAKQNLIKENYSEEQISITGNTSIDALFYTLKMTRNDDIVVPNLTTEVFKKPIVLITGHRRENFGQGFLNICKAINSLADDFPNINFIYPVHLNPNVRTTVYELLSGKENIFLIEPLGYKEFVYLMDKSSLILTDSGGIQEEAPSIGKPLIVMRDTTERPEVIKQNAAILVGTEYKKIVTATKKLLQSKNEYNKIAKVRHIYGDGKASKKIAEIIKKL